jgi:hypothetical protein
MFGRAYGLVLLLLSSSSLVRADEGWRAPAGCPDGDDAEERLKALHTDPALLNYGQASVTIDVAPSGERRARVRLRHEARIEQRVLYDRSCDALAEAVLLVISLAFEGQHAERPREAARAADRSTRVAVAPLVSFDVGSLPDPTFAVGGALRLSSGRVAGELAGRYFLAREEEVAGLARGRFGLATGGATACYTFVERWFAGCAALEIGRAMGRALDTPGRREARGLWIAALMGVELALPAPRLTPLLALEVGFPFQRHSFDVDGAGSVFETRSVVGRLSLRLALRLL